MASVREFGDRLHACRAAVYDINDTLVFGKPKDLGRRILARELGRVFSDPRRAYVHARSFGLGLSGYRAVRRAVARDGEAEGMKLFFDILGKARCVDINTTYEFALEYVRRNTLPGAADFARYVGSLHGGLSFVATAGPDIGAEATRAHFGFAGAAKSNEVLYDDDMIVSGIRLNVRNGAEKLAAVRSMLAEHGLSMHQCLVVGNDSYDHEMMGAAGLSAASPLADGTTRWLADIWIPDYAAFLEELKRSPAAEMEPAATKA